MAAEASTASAVISPALLSKALNSPDITSTAPSSSIGFSAPASVALRPTRSKSTYFSSSDRRWSIVSTEA